MPSQDSAQFCKSYRLLKPSEFKFVFDQPNKVSTYSFLTFSRESQSEHSRIGLAISKKNAKLAVDRNRIKRLVRESFRLNREKLPEIDIVVLAKRGILEQENEALQKQLYGLWKKLARQYAA